METKHELEKYMIPDLADMVMSYNTPAPYVTELNTIFSSKVDVCDLRASESFRNSMKYLGSNMHYYIKVLRFRNFDLYSEYLEDRIELTYLQIEEMLNDKYIANKTLESFVKDVE